MPIEFHEKMAVKGVASSWIVAGLLLTHSATAAVVVDFSSGCGDAAAFRSELADLVEAEALAALDLQARIVRLGDGTFRLHIRSSDWSRELSDADCDALRRAALVIAAAASEGRAPPDTTPIEKASPDRAPVTSEPPLEQASEPSPPLVARVQRKDEEALPPGGAQEQRSTAPAGTKKELARQRPRPRREAFMFAAGGAEWGSAPEVRGLLSVGTGMRWGSFGAGLDARFFPPVTSLTVDNKGLRLLASGVRLTASWDPIEIFHLLLGVSLTRFDARGEGIAASEWDQAYMPAVEVEAQLRPFRIGHFAADFALRARVGLSRPVFVIDPDTTAYETSRWGGAALFRTLAFF